MSSWRRGARRPGRRRCPRRILLDCPPSLGSLPVNALTAADRLVIVTEPGLLALQGMSDLLETVDVVQGPQQATRTVRGSVAR